MPLALYTPALPLLNAHEPLSPMVWQNRLLHSIYDESDGFYHSDPLGARPVKHTDSANTVRLLRK